ncbi:MAG: hypothetical protein ABIQ93_13995 [Saprospiraceae bacterium]
MNNRLCGSRRPVRTILHNPFFVLAACLFALRLTAQSPVPALPPLDSLTEAQVADIALQLQRTAVAQRQVADLQLHNAQALRGQEETALAAGKADTLSPKDQVLIREKNLKSAKNAERVAQKNFKQSEKNLALAESTLQLDSLARRKSLPKLHRQLNDLQAMLYPPPPAIETPPVAAAPSPRDTNTTAPKVSEVPLKKEKKPELPGKKYKSYDPQADVMLHPPVPPCALAMDRRDEFSGEVQRETARAELFRFTNPVLKSYLQGKVHILCEAALSSIGPNTSLILSFTIRDPNVRKAFGNLPKNSIAILYTLDGTAFTVYNQQFSEGLPDDTGQVFSFRGLYPLDRVMLKKLRTTGLDKLRIAWATGYEDYEVHSVDLLGQEAQCLEQ